MAKRKLKEKEIMEHLRSEGYKEINSDAKKTDWYKKASRRADCLISKTETRHIKTH